jgi:CubicO group peptidase (beta-lactamase class C family)
MQLVESGGLRLNDTVARHLPWFGASHPALAEITVRDLLAHTSGLSRRDGLANWTDDVDEPAALERNARRLARTPPSHAIGVFEYSNANYDLLGYLVEVVSGQPFDVYLAERVFAPLGMTHSYVSVGEARQAGLAQGHYPFLGVPLAHQIPSVRGSAPSAFLMSSAADLGQLLVALLDEGATAQGRVLQPASLAVMGRPLVATRDGSAAYAMGLRVEPLVELGSLRERRAGVIDYQVPVSLQHGGDHATYASHVLLLPREGWGIAIVMNLNDVTAPARYHRLAEEVAAILLGRSLSRPTGWLGLLVEHARPMLIATLLAQIGLALVVVQSARTGRGRLCLRRRNRIEAAAATGIGLLIAIAAGLVVGVHSDAPLTLAPRLAPDIGLAVALIVLLGAALGPLRALATPLPGEPDRSARPPPQRNGRDRTMRPGGVPGG